MNEQNLVPLNKRTKSEQREIQSDGGKKSGEARRKRKTLKNAVIDILSRDVIDDEIYNSAAEMGVDITEMTYQAAIVAALVRKAAAGDVAAFREIRNLLGEDSDAERLKLQKKELSIKEKNLPGNGDTKGVTIVDDIGED